jgi:hypothetical protein
MDVQPYGRLLYAIIGVTWRSIYLHLLDDPGKARRD